MKDGKVLDSWKEIAAYLGRSEKTCRRLEKELGLPVHRLEESPKARVFAYKDEIDSWIEKTKHSEKKTFRFKLRSKKISWIVPLAIIPIIIFSVLMAIFIFQRSTNSLAGKPSILVAYFQNETEDEILDFWRVGLSKLIELDLSQSKYLNILNQNRLSLFDDYIDLDIQNIKNLSLEEFKEIALKTKTKYLVAGAYKKGGNSFVSDIDLIEVNSGKILYSDNLEVEREDAIFALVDELTRRIKSSLSIPEDKLKKDIDKNIATITTRSIDAYKVYCEAFERTNSAQSIQYLEKAIELDPQFGLAYLYLSARYFKMGAKKEFEKYKNKVLQLSERIPIREYYSYRTNIVPGAFDEPAMIDACHKLLEVYPDDVTANNTIGVLYRNREEWDKAIEFLEICRKVRTCDPVPYYNLAIVYGAKGFYNDATKVLDFYMDEFAESDYIYYLKAENYFHQGRYDKSLEAIDNAIVLYSSRIDAAQIRLDYSILRENIFLCTGDYKEFEKENNGMFSRPDDFSRTNAIGGAICYDLLKGRFIKAEERAQEGIQLAKANGWESYEYWFRIFLGNLYNRKRDYDAALQEFEACKNLILRIGYPAEERLTLFYLGRTHINLGSISKANNIANELKKVIDKEYNKKLIRDYFHLLGLIKLKEENYKKSFELLSEAISLLHFQKTYEYFNNHALFINSLASAYYVAGNLDQAIIEYEKIRTLSSGRIIYGDIYALSYFKLGKIFDQKGYKSRAIMEYKSFLNLWEDADPGIAEVEDARRRLENLQSQ